MCPDPCPPAGTHADPAGAPDGRLYGPDVSRYQPDTDWQRVRSAGNSFGIVKATQGGTYVNPYLGHDLTGLRENGMIYGAYHFAEPNRHPGRSGAHAEADHYAAVLTGHGGLAGPRALRPILDLEGRYIAGHGRRTLTAWIIAWFDRVDEILGTGGGIVYANRSDAGRQMDGAHLSARGHQLWLAHWTRHAESPQGPAPRGWERFVLQQYTDRARVPGVRGPCDRSLAWSDITGLLVDG